MTFSPLSDFISKFNKITLPNETIRRTAVESINNICGFNIPIDVLSFRNGVLNVSISGSQKSEIYLNRDRILKEINSKLSRNIVTEIR